MAASCLWAADLCSEKQELLSFGRIVKETHQVTSNQPIDPVEHRGARHMRLRLRIERAGSCPWKLAIRDASFRPIQVLTAADFPAGAPLWSARVTGHAAYMDLLDCPPRADGPDIRSDEHIWLPASEANPQYSIKDKNGVPDWKPLGNSGAGAKRMRLGDSTGFLLGATASELTNWKCSGVLIAAGLFLTNWHCLEPLRNHDPNSMRGLLVDMSWDGDASSDDYQVESLEEGTAALDFALLKVTPLSRNFSSRPAVIRKAAPQTGEVFVIHHPQGAQKMISANGCTVAALNYPNAASPALSHTCDTSNGSSGSPLFDSSGRVMALHFCGFNSESATERFNRAVRMDEILKWLATKAKTDAKTAEILKQLRFE
jgi:V8-like Glu-specific endopeptidase